MALSEIERAETESYLSSAKKAYHELMIGASARVFVDQNGERVEFNAANAERLRSYIMSLQVALGLPTGITGPMRFNPL